MNRNHELVDCFTQTQSFLMWKHSAEIRSIAKKFYLIQRGKVFIHKENPGVKSEGGTRDGGTFALNSLHVFSFRSLSFSLLFPM